MSYTICSRFKGGILCMQGTQYAPRESILCMEHFLALHCTGVGVINALII